MRPLTVTALLLASAPAFAGNPCAKAKVVEDPFTKQSTTIVSGFDWSIESAADGKVVWKQRYGAGGDVDVVLDVGWTTDLLLEDGTIVTFASTEKALPVTGASQYGVFTNWMVTFPVDAATTKTVAASTPTAMRADLGQGPVSMELKGPRGKNMQKAFVCMASLLKPTATSTE